MIRIYLSVPRKMTQITNNDVIEKNDVSLPKKMTRSTENDVVLNNEKINDFLCLEKWHESLIMPLLKKWRFFA